MFLLIGTKFSLGWRPSTNAFWLAPVLLGVAIFCIYGLVNIEERYVTVGFFTILLPLFATLRVSSTSSSDATRTASALILLLALLATGASVRTIAELRRQLSVAKSPGGWYDPDTFRAARALNALGVGPGDTIACIGTRACVYDHYWARLAGVRILTEIYEPEAPLYPALAAMTNRDQAIDVVRQQGDKVLVGYFNTGLMTGATPVSAGWHELDQTPLYILPLNLSPETKAE